MLTVTPVLVGMLTNLGEVCRADALALWIPLDDRLDLVADWRLDQRLYDLLQGTLDLTALRVGRVVQAEAGVAALPVLGADGTLVAILQYVGVLPDQGVRWVFLHDTMKRLATVLGDALPHTAEGASLLNLVPCDLVGESQELERRTYMDFLERCGWDVSLAASALEMTRQALYDLMCELDLARPMAMLKRGGRDS